MVIAIISLLGMLRSITVLSSRFVHGPVAVFIGPMPFLMFYLGIKFRPEHV